MTSLRVIDRWNGHLVICSFHAASTPNITMRVLIESKSLTSAHVTFANDINWIAESNDVFVLHLNCLYCMSGLSSSSEAFIVITVHHAL